MVSSLFFIWSSPCRRRDASATPEGAGGTHRATSDGAGGTHRATSVGETPSLTLSFRFFWRLNGNGHPRRVLRQRADKPFMFRFRLRRKAFQLLERGPS